MADVVNLPERDGAAPADSVVEAHGLSRVYGEGDAAVHALRGVTLGVERDNPRARALYERLGFALVGQDDRDHLLRWEPPQG